MENVHDRANGNGVVENGHCTPTRLYDYQSNSCSSIKSSLSWLDLRVFYVRLCKCEIDELSTPEYLTLNHVPLNRDTLLEVNGVRTSIYSDGVSTVLRRDRVDKKSEEVTFVSTDSIRMTGSVKFEVFDKDVLLLSGSLQECDSNGFNGGDSRSYSDHHWTINCESGVLQESGLIQGNQYGNLEPGSPAIEVYVAGCFLGSPIILSKILHLGQRRKQMRKGMLDSIPEYETSDYQKDSPSPTLQMQVTEENDYKHENEDYNHPYPPYFDAEDEELTWFNAGVRVGVGIGLSICVGVGIGVGLVVKAYQGTTRNFRRRLF